MFTVSVDMRGLEKKMADLVARGENITPPLKRFGAYLKRRAVERYKEQNFEPLKTSTIEGRAAKGLKSLERKLHRDLLKAVARSNPGGQSRSILSALIEAPGSEINTSRGVQNRLAVWAEFQRRHRPTGSLSQRAGLKPLTIKQSQSLGGRIDRALSRAVSRPILGGLVYTIKFEVERNRLTLASRTHKHFSAIHNEGGEGGHGARIPKRETVKLDEEDLAVAEAILRDYFLEAFA